uniref:Uncharacterized protein LOC104242140 n=1 Tax=Nicotiana sylvestris TaxID=4096 RepID=A0A1U7Y9D0_NICSY|nr:PREDICTED: uncharacterized protein LOC104242140 [Nicotiana sylvestris]
MTKKDSKAQMMRWALLLQEFDLEIVNWKVCEKQVANHLSHLEEEGRSRDGLEINDSFPDEQLLFVSVNSMPWFADIFNFLVTGIIPYEISSNQRKKLKWDNFLFFSATMNLIASTDTNKSNGCCLQTMVKQRGKGSKQGGRGESSR